MARAHFETYILDGEGRPVPGASVTVREPDTTTSISETIYAADTPDTTTKANPFTADVDGRVVIYLASPKVVDLLVKRTGFDDRTVRATAFLLTASTAVLKAAGSTMNQRSATNFLSGFLLADDSAQDETEVSLDYGTDVSTQAFGDAAVQGSGTKPPHSNHKHAMPVDPVTAHVAAGDPHSGYVPETEMGAIHFDSPAIGGSVSNTGAQNDTAWATLMTTIGVAGGKRAVFSSGVYSFASAINWTRDRCRITGGGFHNNTGTVQAGVTSFKYTGASTIADFFTLSGANCVVTDIGVDGNLKATNIFRVQGADSFVNGVSVSEFVGENGYGIYCDGSRSTFAAVSVDAINAGTSTGIGAYAADMIMSGPTRVRGATKFTVDNQGNGLVMSNYHLTAGNQVSGTLNVGITTTSATTMTVDEIAVPALATVPFNALIDAERVTVTARVLVSGRQYTYTITRGASGTTAATHSAGAQVITPASGNLRIGGQHSDIGTGYVDTCQGGPLVTFEKTTAGLNDAILHDAILYDVNTLQTLAGAIAFNGLTQTINAPSVVNCTLIGAQAWPWTNMLTASGTVTASRFQGNTAFAASGFYNATPSVYGGNIRVLTRGGTEYIDSTAAVVTHEAAADPHTGYQKESERAAASGYAPLDSSTELPIVNLKAHTPAKHSAIMAQGVKAATQSIATGANLAAHTLITFSSASLDTAGIFNNAGDKFVVPAGYAGQWRFTFHLVIEAPAATHRMRASIYKNGVRIKHETNGIGPNDTDGGTATCSVLSTFAVNDEITFYGAQNDGTSRNVMGDGTLNTTHAEAEFLGV